MRMKDKAARRGRTMPQSGRAGGTWRLLGGYTLLFAVFFAAVFSPFWVYGRSLVWGTDGAGLYLPILTYSRHWARQVLQSLLAGKPELPFWELCVGFGQNTIGNPISYRPFNFLYELFPRSGIEAYLFVRFAASLYLAGLSFLAYGRTRVKSRPALLMGAMLYLFTGFLPFYTTKHWFYLGMAFALPLMLLGVDRIFDGKWSWLFVFTVFKEGVCGFYQLFMITVPAVVYALFHFFELSVEERRARGGFGRILLRHIGQYAVGLCLAAVGLLPVLMGFFTSGRTAAQTDVKLLAWEPKVYLDFIRGIVDARAIANNGFIALPGVAIIALLCLVRSRKKTDRLLLGQLALYGLAFLIPALTLFFSGFMGKTMRWCYIFSFWAAMCAARGLPRLWRDDGGAYTLFSRVFCAYTLVYLGVSVWTGEGISLSLVAAILGAFALRGTATSNWGRRRRGAATALVLVVLLAELTTRSYEWFSPQYGAHVSTFANAGTVLRGLSSNAADAFELAEDEGVYRVDLVMDSDEGTAQANYGMYNLVNGVSSYFSISDGEIVNYSLQLGNAHQKNSFMIMDLDHRAALNALAGVKYAAALEADVDRIPYGYEQVASRKKKLSDGTRTREYLYRNNFALPIAYAYEKVVSAEDYAALPPNRKEQAMLQGAVLEGDLLPRAELSFDDRVVLGGEDFMAALAEAAEGDENLEIAGNALRVKKDGYSVSIPIGEAEGELYVQLRGARYQSVNLYREQTEKLLEEEATRLRVTASQRRARQWEPATSAVITASTGGLSDEGMLLGPGHQYYFGERDLLLNLGYGQPGKKLKLRFSDAGEYSFDSLEFICQPMDSYGEKVAELQRNGAISTQVEGNVLRLEFDLENSGFACVAIPYSSGWRARVDGARAEVLPANGMYMGVLLPAGRHQVELSYSIRGFWPGLAISLATLAALAVGALATRARRRRGPGGERRRVG